MSAVRRRGLLVLGALLLGGGSVGAYLAFKEPRVEVVPPRAPTSPGAEVRLRRSPFIDAALGDRLAPYVVALGRVRPRAGAADTKREGPAWARVRETRDALVSPNLRAALGEAATSAFVAMLDAAEEVVFEGNGADGRAERLALARGAASEALADAGLAYFLDSYLAPGRSGVHVILHGFELEHASRFRVGPLVVRAPNIRRLDRLNWERGVLGFAGPEQRDALVLLDQLEEDLVTEILPAAGSARGMKLVDDRGAAEVSAPLREALERKAGDVARAELEAVAGPAGRTLCELIARRIALVDAARPAIARLGGSLSFPPRLLLSEKAIADIAEYLPRKEGRELRDVEKDLRRASIVAAFARVRDAAADGVEAHEVQHRLDYVRKGGLPMPEALARYAGPEVMADGRERAYGQSAKMELSAYVAELARDRAFPRATLARLLRFVLRPRLQGTDYSDALLTILEGLAAELGVATKGPLVQNRNIVRETAAALGLALLDVPADKLRAAADALWRKLFGAPLDVVTREVAP